MSRRIQKRGAATQPKHAAPAQPRAAKNRRLSDEQWLRAMRRMVRTISLQLDDLEVIFRAIEVFESKQAVRSWFNDVVPALAGRPIDLCQTARGRQAVLRELGRIEHGA